MQWFLSIVENQMQSPFIRGKIGAPSILGAFGKDWVWSAWSFEDFTVMFSRMSSLATLDHKRKS